MVALKGIPAVLSPDLLFALARMGHGDEIGERAGAGRWGPWASAQSTTVPLVEGRRNQALTWFWGHRSGHLALRSRKAPPRSFRE